MTTEAPKGIIWGEAGVVYARDSGSWFCARITRVSPCVGWAGARGLGAKCHPTRGDRVSSHPRPRDGCDRCLREVPREPHALQT